jgi:hypothetical protein
VVRHLDDLLRLVPRNVDRELFLFNVGVFAGGLDSDDALGKKVLEGRLKAENEKLAELATGLDRQRHDPAKPAPAELPAPPLPGAGGGGGAAGAMGMGAPGRRGGVPKSLEDKKDGYRDGRTGGKGDGEGGEGKARMGQAPADVYFDERLEKRLGVRQLYRKIDPTVEWAENNYYKVRIDRQVADLVTPGPFWLDYARHDGKSPFLSRHLADAGRNFTEMMFALSVLDLPFEAPKHDVQFAGGKMTVVPAAQAIAFHEEVRPAAGNGGRIPILVSQNVYRHGDRFREEGGEKYDKFVTGEFLTQAVYGCQVVVTNPTSSRQKLTVLVQLPLGAIPVASGQMTRSIPVDLEPYRTHTLDYFFYFPKAGRYPQFPAHVAKNGEFVIAAPTATFDVVERPTKPDTTSWDHVSQHGTDAEVLAYLDRENVRALNLERIAFRLRDRGFFEAVTRLLTDRHTYHPTTWSYGLFHADVPTAREFLGHHDALVAQCGGPIDSPLLTVDPVARHQYEHLEYRPLVNARAHALGQRRQIVNDALHAQYHKFLKTLTYRKELGDDALLAAAYYLLLQDRVGEAVGAFARVDPGKVATRVQYDYCAAYLELFKDDPGRARAIATAHLFHPVDRWRNAFAAVVAQVDEVEGKAARPVIGEEHNQNQGGLAATEPGFEVAVGAQGVSLSWQNLESVRVSYYLMDVELLFSTSPFVQRAGGQFATIRPNASEVLKLPAGRTRHTFPLPAEFEGRNVLVEVTAGGKTRSVPHLASTMAVQVSEGYGQLRVTDAPAGKAVGRVYVKVYAKLADGGVRFHKDGYTDLRGRFDYATVNTPERQAVERFAILVLSDDRGAVIRDVPPPQR